MRILERHESPDKLLVLGVWETDSDIMIGFEGLPWHTHGDILSELSGLSQSDAIREFVDQLIQDRQLICVSTIDEAIRDAWPVEKPYADPYKPAEESMTFRYWSGRGVSE